jgi:anti-sigma B factor antagonist
VGIEIRTSETLTTLALEGRIVAEESSDLRTKIETLLRSPAPVKVIDLTDIAFIDSFALGQLVYYCNNSGGGNGPVYVLNCSSDTESYIDKLIEISELRQVFTIVKSLDEIGKASDGHGG